MVEPDPNAAAAPPALPEGIASVEALVQSYNHAQQKITQQGQELSTYRQGQAPIPQQAPMPQQAPVPQQQVPSLGIQQQSPQGMSAVEYIGQFAGEFNANQGLSEGTYQRIQAEKGWDRHLVDGYIQGQLARNREIQNAGFQAVGGEQNFQALAAHIQANWSPEQISAFNHAVTSGDQHLAQMAVQGAWTQYQQSEGGAMNLLQGQNGIPASMNMAEGFRDEKEWMASMEGENYEKYGNDAEYRRSVIRKLANSQWAYQDPRHKEVDRKTFLEGALDGLDLPR